MNNAGTISIEWLTKSSQMYKAYYGHEDSQIFLKGGRLYEMEVIKVLTSLGFDVCINSKFIKREGIIRYIFKSSVASVSGNICVLDPYVLSLGKFDKSRINIAIIHHINLNESRSNIYRKILQWNLFRNLRSVDCVVTVSKYWENYFKNKGLESVNTIYNSYNISQYDIAQYEIDKFKENLSLDLSKPIIYLGQNSRGKGIEKVLQHIDISRFNLVVTGKVKYPREDISTFYFSNEEYLLFLASCDVVISMSTMEEGWNRIAHEAMLVKTPVIGSGVGGMRELLLKGRQVVITDYNLLNKKIDYCLRNRNILGESGFSFVSRFNSEYFQREWLKIITQCK